MVASYLCLCHLLSTMVVVSSAQERCCQDAGMEGVDVNDTCNPTYFLPLHGIPLEAMMTQLLREVACLRHELLATRAQVSSLMDMLSHFHCHVSEACAAQSPPVKSHTDIGAERSIAAITLRKVVNKKIAHTKVSAITSHNFDFAKLQEFFSIKVTASFVTKALCSQLRSTLPMEKFRTRSPVQRITRGDCVVAKDTDLAPRLPTVRAEAYEKGGGLGDSGNTNLDRSDGHIYILCGELSCYRAWSGRGPFCETCYVAHSDDAHYWLT